MAPFTNSTDDRVKCASCGKKVVRRESLSDYRLRDAEGKYCRYCFDCRQIFEETINSVEDPSGLVFPPGIEVDLGDKDPFFRIRFVAEAGEAPAWKIVPPGDEAGGLLVFVRKVGNFIESTEPGKNRLTCAVVISKKSQRVAFAEPHTETEEEPKEEKGVEEKAS